MIVTQAPLRIPLGGGGTDFPSYYLAHGGYILGFALDKYVRVVIHPTEDRKIRLKYSKAEECDLDRPDDLENRVAAEALKWFGFDKFDKGIEVVTFSDVPECSGLGGSSAFCVALVRALAHMRGIDMDPYETFAAAWEIERIKANEAGGMQDQFFSAMGGAWRLSLCDHGDAFDHDRVDDIVNPLLPYLSLVNAGGRNYISHSGVIADRQEQGIKSKDTNIVESLHQTKVHGFQMEAALRNRQFEDVGRIFNEHWENKKRRDQSISNDAINDLHRTVCNGNGVSGAKLLGLGGGGYLLCYSDKMTPSSLAPITVGIDPVGSIVVYDDKWDD